MRWSDLFADLEAQASGLAAAEVDAEVAERTRIDVSRLTFTARLGGALGHPVELRCAGAGIRRARLDRVGADWLLATEPGDVELLVPVGAVLAVKGLGRWSSPVPAGRAEPGLRAVLRRIARDRSPVRAVLTDGTAVTGTVDRVGVDFFELAEHPLDVPRRATAVTAVRAVPLPALGLLCRR
jgi:hypothetical protein